MCKKLVKLAGDKLPIIANQENFILRSNSYKVNQALPDFKIFFKPSVKEHIDGRPKNGMFIAIPEKIKSCVIDVSPDNWRVQAVIVNTEKSKLLVLNTYFPVDKQNNANNDELLETLATIRSIFDNNQCDCVFLGGDINTDFVRESNQVRTVVPFLNDYKLMKSWDSFNVDFTHHQEIDNISHISTIDHFFWNRNLFEHILDCGVLHLPENTADHSPIYCVIDLNHINCSTEPPVKGVPKPCWKKASDNDKMNYNNNIYNKLTNIEIPDCVTNCNDLHCKDPNHIEAIDSTMINFLENIELAAEESLPKTGSGSESKHDKRNTIPGWDESVQPFKETAHFWHSIWLSLGRSINCEIHNVMKRSRNVYHYHLRKCKKAQDKIKRDKLLNACINGNGNIFKEIKALRRSKASVASSIDGNNENVTEHFAQIYSGLYNSVDGSDDIDELKKQVNESITIESLDDVNKVVPDIVRSATKHLKAGKTDPACEFSSDCLINGPDVLFEVLATMIRSFLIHAHITKFLLLATLVPIIKDKLGNVNSSKNYRSIALSSLILKIFDWVVLLLFGASLKLDELQFAYQAGCSTTMCSWMAIETISYFLRNGSEVFSCLMDMTKAFDVIKHSVLFKKLIHVGLSVIFVRLMLVIYSLQFANVRWNQSFSEVFSIRNGVRQGAILSGILYCFYCNGLFQKLRNAKSGCWINENYHGILGYSDDNFLLAPSLSALQEMLIICEKYAEEHGLMFSTNPDPKKCKTKCIAFLLNDREIRKLRLCGNDLPWDKSGKHIGNNIKNTMDGMTYDMLIKRAKYIDKNNQLVQEFSFAHPKTKLLANQIFNCHFTGSSLWNLFCKDFERIENSYNISVRKMLNVPRETHRFFLEPLSEQKHIRSVLIKGFLSFIQQIKKSPKTLPMKLLNTIKCDVTSVTGLNLRNIMLLVKKDNIDDLNITDANSIHYCEVDQQNEWKIEVAKELIEAKYGNIVLENFDEKDIKEMLTFICTS